MSRHYGLRAFGDMIADRVRMAAYRAALERAVQPGSVVVDLGAGSGIMSLLACQLGARRVYAIEPNDLVEVARELAIANGFGDRIQIIRDVSTRVELPEPCDVIVSDLRGIVPFHEQHLPALADARRRFLRPGGVLIPERDEVRIAVVAAEGAYRECRSPWGDGAAGLDMSPAERMTVNQLARSKVSSETLVTAPHTWATIDYRSIASPSARGAVAWTIDRHTMGHGLRVWFDTTLAPGIGFSNAPDAPETVYGALFLPWSDPVELAPGDQVAVEIWADLVGKDYVWRWSTTVTAGDGPSPKARFRQSTFLGTSLSSARLSRRDPEHVATLGDDGRVAAFVLGAMTGARSVGDIARELAARYPAMFADEAAALAETASLVDRYGR